MKKIPALLLVATLLTGCTDDHNPVLPVTPLQTVSITVEGNYPEAEGPESRATITPGYVTQWEENDQIAFFARSYDGKCTHQYLTTIGLSADRRSASFGGDVVLPDEIDTFYAAHSESCTVITHEHAIFEIPAFQTATVSPRIMMVAKTAPTTLDELVLNFTPVDAFLHITLTGTATAITQIVLEACSNEDLAGTYTYNFGDDTNTVIGSKRITVTTNGLNDFYIAVPAIRLESGYKLTFSNETGEQMVKSYGFGKPKTFRRGDIATLEVREFIPVSISASDMDIFKSSYDFYTTEGVSAANTKDGSTIYGGKLGYTTEGISTTMIDQVGLLLDGLTEIPATTWNKAERTFEIGNITGVDWALHSLQIYIKHAGQIIATSAAKEVAVTGLPYTAAPPTEAEWTKGSWNTSWNGSYVQIGGVSGSGEASVSLRGFHIPQDIDIYVVTDCHIRASKIVWTQNTTFTLNAGSTTLITQNSNGTQRDYTLYSDSGTLTPVANVIKCQSSYTAAGPYVRIYSLTVSYR